MTQTILNYARVLYELDIDEAVIEDTKSIFDENPVLVDTLASPVIRKADKEKVIDKVFNRDIRNFLKVLSMEAGARLFPEIYQEYRMYSMHMRNILPATLYYVEPPTEEQKKGLEHFLMKQYKTDAVRLDMVKKEELIGGFVIRTGDDEYDWSLLGRYKQLKQELVTR